jgi:hypothetical protein
MRDMIIHHIEIEREIMIEGIEFTLIKNSCMFLIIKGTDINFNNILYKKYIKSEVGIADLGALSSLIYPILDFPCRVLYFPSVNNTMLKSES